MKFTMEHSWKQLPLLDILIKNVNGQIIKDISHKPTDTLHYLLFKSHRPKNCIKSIPYTLARRIHSISKSKVGDRGRGQPEATTPRCRGGRYSFSWIDPLYPRYVPLYCWVLSQELSSTIFKVFGMTRPEIEPKSPGPLENSLPTRPMSRYTLNNHG